MLNSYLNGEEKVKNGAATIRFGAFEADLHSGEVRKSGNRVKLQDQPFKILQILLERPGHLVTREELQTRIWPDENYGDFDHAVNVAVGKLRTALGDTADNPSFIETVPRRGYRFVAPIATPEPPAAEVPPLPPPVAAPPPPPAKKKRRWLLPVLGAIIAAALFVRLGLLGGGNHNGRRAPEVQRLTVRHGTVSSARFAPDGHSVIYAASWEGKPLEIFSGDLNLN